MVKTLRAYRKAGQELVEGQYASVRELAPPHLRVPCHIYVMCYPDGVLVRYDAAGEEEPTAHALPDGEGWLFEPKWDGFRALVFRAMGFAAEEAMVRRLSAGAEWIRTFSSAPDGQQFVVSSELGPMDRRTVIQAVAGLGEPLEFRAAVRGAATHRLDQAGVTPNEERATPGATALSD
jgi:hypothetical protein